MRVWLVALAVGVGGCVAPGVEDSAPDPVVTSEPVEAEPTPTEDPTPGDDIEAGIFCERFLDRRSGPYEHGSYLDYTASYVDGVWRVSGELADGTPWACGVEPNADASEWTLVELELYR